MAALFGTSLLAFILVTVIVTGGAALLTGHALASRWRPMWHLFPFSLLLGFGDRFLVYALFGGDLTSIPGYVVDTILVGIVATVSYRWFLARKMVTQYPWLYEARGVFGWTDRHGESR